MKAEKIEEDIKGRLVDHYNVPEEDITATMNLNDVTIIDSLDKVELVMWAEDKYKISISDEQTESINTFGDIVSLVKDKLNL